MLHPDIQSQITFDNHCHIIPSLSQGNPLALIPYLCALHTHLRGKLIVWIPDEAPATPFQAFCRRTLMESPLEVEILSDFSSLFHPTIPHLPQPNWYRLARTWEASQPRWDDPTPGVPLVEYCR